MKIARSCISNVVGRPRQVVKPRNIAMLLLVNDKEPQYIHGNQIGGGASFPFSEDGAKIITLAEDCALTNIKSLG